MAIAIEDSINAEENSESETFLKQFVRDLVPIMDQQYKSSQLYTQSLKRKRRIKAPKPDLIFCHQPKFPFSLSIKIEIAQRRIGRELRQVADYYDKNVRSSRRRRIHGQSQLSFFTLNICVSLTFLSVTLLTFLKKKL